MQLTCTVLSEAYGAEAMKKSSVSEWHKQFRVCRENVEDDERTGRPVCHETDSAESDAFR
jgi:hypothetical protein